MYSGLYHAGELRSSISNRQSYQSQDEEKLDNYSIVNSVEKMKSTVVKSLDGVMKEDFQRKMKSFVQLYERELLFIIEYLRSQTTSAGKSIQSFYAYTENQTMDYKLGAIIFALGPPLGFNLLFPTGFGEALDFAVSFTACYF